MPEHRSPELKPGQHAICVGFDGAISDRLVELLKSCGFEAGAIRHEDEFLELLANAAINLVIVYDQLPDIETREFVKKLRDIDPFVEILVAGEQPPDQLPPNIFDAIVLSDLSQQDSKVSRLLTQAMRRQNLSERNTALFRTLMTKDASIKALNAELKIRRSENRMLTNALAEYTADAEKHGADQATEEVADSNAEIEKLSNSLQVLVEKLGEEFSQALDSMLFYASQILHQSAGSEEGAALSNWIQHEVERLRESYQAVIQEHYARTMEE